MPEKRSLRIMTGLQINRALSDGWVTILVSLYVVVACGLIAFFSAPVSRSLGLARSDTALVLDFAILIVGPLGLIICRSFLAHRRQQRVQRQRLIDAHSGERLVVTRFIPHEVYRVTGGGPESGWIEVVPIWKAGGPVVGATAHVSEISNFEPLVPEKFVGN